MRQLIDGTAPRNVASSRAEMRARRDEILEVCSRNRASNVWVFGSVVRGEQDEQSDVDLLADIEPGRSLFELAGLISELEDVLGCPVNAVEHKKLTDHRFSRRIRNDMVRL